MGRISYRGYRFPPDIIQRAVWLYFRFTLSFRDVEDLLAERGIEVSYEPIRQWVTRFGPAIARHLRSRRPRPHGQVCEVSSEVPLSPRSHLQQLQYLSSPHLRRQPPDVQT